VHLRLEPDIRPARFDAPAPDDIGNRETVGLLSSACSSSTPGA
jgi:hypothetical protein